MRTAALRSRLGLTLGALALVAFAAALVVSQLSGGNSSDLRFSVAMAKRPVPPTTADAKTLAAYVNPTSWTTTVDACKAKAVSGRKGQPLHFQWTFTTGGYTKVVSGGCRLDVALPKLGRYTVSLTLLDSRNKKVASTTQSTALNDVLVVSVGDSVAAGEGSPDSVAPDTAHPGQYTPTWQDRQ